MSYIVKYDTPVVKNEFCAICGLLIVPIITGDGVGGFMSGWTHAPFSSTSFFNHIAVKR